MTITKVLNKYADNALDYFKDTTPKNVQEAGFGTDRAAAISTVIRVLYRNGTLQEAFPLLDKLNHPLYDNETVYIHELRDDIAHIIHTKLKRN